MPTCVYCQDWNGEQPIPACVKRGGPCRYEDGCDCVECQAKDKAWKERRKEEKLYEYKFSTMKKGK